MIEINLIDKTPEYYREAQRELAKNKLAARELVEDTLAEKELDKIVYAELKKGEKIQNQIHVKRSKSANLKLSARVIGNFIRATGERTFDLFKIPETIREYREGKPFIQYMDEENPRQKDQLGRVGKHCYKWDGITDSKGNILRALTANQFAKITGSLTGIALSATLAINALKYSITTKDYSPLIIMGIANLCFGGQEILNNMWGKMSEPNYKLPQNKISGEQK